MRRIGGGLLTENGALEDCVCKGRRGWEGAAKIRDCGQTLRYGDVRCQDAGHFEEMATSRASPGV